MSFKGERTVDCDVLVIGSGIAGMRAAIQANKYGVKVVLVEKGLLGRCGETIFAGGGMVLERPLISDPSEQVPTRKRRTMDEEIFALIDDDDWQGNARYMRDQRIAEIIATEMYIRQDELRDYGVENPFSSAFLSPTVRGGANLVLPLVEYAKEKGVETLERTTIFDLVKAGEKVVGAIGFHLGTKEYLIFKAKSTILATGGMGAVYQRNDVPKGITGDGYAMALRAGVELQDMEFQKWERHMLDEPSLPQYMILGEEFIMRNANGEPFMDNYLKKLDMLKPDATLNPEDPSSVRYGINLGGIADFVALASALEIHEGRGDDGAVYLDYTKSSIDEDFWQKGPHERRRRYVLRDFPWKEKLIRVAPGAISTHGGLRTNEWCETNITGLYAAGDIACGSGLKTANLFGVRAGSRAAEYALETGQQEFNKEVSDWIAYRKRMLTDILQREATPEGEPNTVHNSIKSIMWKDVSVLRTFESMERAIEELRSFKRNILPKLHAKNFRDLRKAVEAMNMVEVSEVTTIAAMYRTESRGFHHRLDYPERDDENWIKNIIIKLEDGELKTYTRPVFFTRFHPPKEYKRRLW